MLAVGMRARDFPSGDSFLSPFKIEKRVKEETLKELEDYIAPKVQKFIDKVESGKARSKETYADMKLVLTFITTKRQ